MPYRSPARWLAPLSLVASLVAVLMILGGGSGDGGEGSAETTPTSGSRVSQTTTTDGTRTTTRRRSTYTVKAGDVLSAIAQRTGVSVTRLQELNPGIDAQALRVGAQLKLRE